MNRFDWAFEKIEQDKITYLADSLNISKHFAESLIKRNINNYDEAKKYFCPSLDQTHSPYLLKDMELAIHRLKKAIQQNEKILIYGDYDVDGTTSVALLYSFLETCFSFSRVNIDVYIPDRIKEGYGVHHHGVEYILQSGVSLVITVDCGITALKEIQTLKDAGIDTIICDHHLPSNEVPNATAILNPKQKDCSYPFKELSACGVVFKWISALAEMENIPQENLIEFLDLVALSTAADIVPLVGENRIFVFLGTEQLRKKKRLSLSMLADACQISEYSVREMVFKLAPRINAAGRIHHAKKSFELLISNHELEIKQLISSLEAFNTERKSLQDKVFAEAQEAYLQLEEQLPFVIAIASKNWYKGVLGIVASKLIETFNKPTFIFTKEKNIFVGSGRSVEGVDLYLILKESAEYIVQFGGHTAAAGVKVDEHLWNDFVGALQKAYVSQKGNKILKPQLSIDSELPLDHINTNTLGILERMKPFGHCHHNPLWLSQFVVLQEEPIIVKENHLRLIWQQGKTTNFSSILFNHAKHFLPHLKKGKPYHILFKLNKETWNHQEKLNTVIEDISMA